MSIHKLSGVSISSLNEDRLSSLGSDGFLVDSSMRETLAGIEVTGDFDTSTAAVGGGILVYGQAVVGDLDCEGDLTVEALAGIGVRPVAADASGKLVIARPGLQQIAAQHGSKTFVPSASDPIFMLEEGAPPVSGSWVLPKAWCTAGNGLSLNATFAWVKQTGISSDLFFGVSITPEDSDEEILIEIPVSLAAEETGLGSGYGALEAELLLTEETDVEALHFESHAVLYNRHDATGETVVWRGSQAREVGISAYASVDETFSVRPYVRFFGTSGTNSFTVHALSLTSHDLQPLN